MTGERAPARADLAGLFQPAEQPEPFRQGEILTFNVATGANTVRVGGGTVLSNLPILVGGDTVNFEPGDAVILIKYRSSWAILGRIVVPGNGDLTATAVEFYANTVFNLTPTDVNNTTQTLASDTIVPPSWANSVVIMAITHGIFMNGSGGGDGIRVLTDIQGGSFGGESIHYLPNDGNFYTVTTPFAETEGPPLSTFTVRSRVRTNGGTWVGGMRACYLNTIAIFRKA